MTERNSILSLAERGFEQQFSLEQLQQGIIDILNEGIDEEQISAALDVLTLPECPSPMLQVIGEICMMIFLAVEEPEAAGQIDLEAAALLSQRPDTFSQLLACVNYERARLRFDRGSEPYVTSLTKEAHLRGSFTGEWSELLPHYETSARLWCEAREYLQPSSPDYAMAEGSEGLIRIRLAEQGVDPPENFERAVRLARRAQHGFDTPSPPENFYLAQVTEAMGLNGLASCGVEALTNLESSVRIVQQCLPHLPTGSPAWGQALLSEANARRILARENVRSADNGGRARDLYGILLSGADASLSGPLLFGQAEAYLALSEAGLEQEANLSEAIARYMRARETLSPDDTTFQMALRQERIARYALADFGVDLEANLKAILSICRHLRHGLAPESIEYCREMVSEADGLRQLAEYASAPVEKLRASIEMFTQARVWLDHSLAEYQFAMIHEGFAHLRLAQHGIQPQANLQTSIDLCQQARLLEDRPRNMGLAFMNEASCRTALGDQGHDPLANIQTAISLFREARRYLSGSIDFGLCLQNEGTAWIALAGLGVSPTANLKQAISLLQQARQSLDSQSTSLAYVQADEAVARTHLADLGVDPTENYRHVIDLCRESRSRLSRNGYGHGRSLLQEGAALQGLSNLGIDPLPNLRASLNHFIEAAKTLEPGSLDFARALLTVAETLRQLAELGVEPKTNLMQARKVCRLAREHLTPGTSFYGSSLVNEGLALWEMAQADEESGALLREAQQSFHASRPHYSSQSLMQPLLNVYEAGVILNMVEAEHEPVGSASLVLELCERANLALEEGSRHWSNAKRIQARALRCLGRGEDAYQHLRASIAVIEGMRSQMRRETERIAFLEVMSSEYAEMVSICIEMAETSPISQDQTEWRWEAWHWVHRGKSRSLLELLASAPPNLSEEEIGDWREVERLSAELDVRDREIHLLQSLLKEDADGTRGNLTAKAIRQVELDRRLAENRRLSADLRNRQLDFQLRFHGGAFLQAKDVPQPEEVFQDLRMFSGADLDAALRPLLVEFFRASHDKVFVFLVPLWERSAPKIMRISTVSGAVGEMVELLDRANTSRHQASRESRVAAADQFRELQMRMGDLVDPWVSFLEQWQPTQLILSPHFLFNLLPLHMARWRDGCLIESFPISYLPSSALARELAKKVKPFRPEALLLGNPLTGQAALDHSIMHLGGAEAEVEAVSAVFQRENIITHCLLREQATTSRLEAMAGSCGIVHLACHSILDRKEFLRSGMELSDRRLTVLDVLWRLKLPNAVLVYLSSCEGAAAVPGQTDELMALARAFFHAGSPTVIASLWEVNDEAGSVFAVSFYRSWVEEKMSMVVAFQQAMLETRELYPSPIDWAPFVLMGAWRTSSV